MPKSVEEILEKLTFSHGESTLSGRIIDKKTWIKLITLAKADLLKLILEVKPKKAISFQLDQAEAVYNYNKSLAEWEEKIKEMFE